MDHILPRVAVNPSVYQNIVDSQRCLGPELAERNLETVTRGENLARYVAWARAHVDASGMDDADGGGGGDQDAEEGAEEGAE